MGGTVTGLLAGGVAGLVLGPWLAGLLHSAPAPGPWWAPWRPTGRRLADTPVSDRVLTTACCTVAGALAGLGAGWGAAWPAFVTVGLAAGPLAVVDARIHRLPDRIVAPTALLTVVLLAAAALARGQAWPLVRALLAGVVVVLVLGVLAAAARGGFGPGDAKTGALLALPLGWVSAGTVVVGLWAGFALAALAALVAIALGRARWRSRLAFGPGLLAGALGVLGASALLG